MVWDLRVELVFRAVGVCEEGVCCGAWLLPVGLPSSADRALGPPFVSSNGKQVLQGLPDLWGWGGSPSVKLWEGLLGVLMAICFRWMASRSHGERMGADVLCWLLSSLCLSCTRAGVKAAGCRVWRTNVF